MNRKLIFFDIDNTLVSHVGKSHIPEATTEAVRLLKRNGHAVAIATARNRCMTRKTAAHFGIDLLVCCDGAHVLDGDRVLHEEWLDASFLEAFRSLLLCAADDYSALDAEYVYTGRNSEAFRDYLAEQAGFDCRRPPIDLQRAYMAYAFHLGSPGPASPDPAKLHPECIAAFASPYYTEYLPRGVSKWSGIRHACSARGFSPADVVAVGDSDNDVEMLLNASPGIAVAKSSPKALEAADLTVSDIDEGGILEAFQKLKMI